MFFNFLVNPLIYDKANEARYTQEKVYRFEARPSSDTVSGSEIINFYLLVHLRNLAAKLLPVSYFEAGRESSDFSGGFDPESSLIRETLNCSGKTTTTFVIKKSSS